MRSAIQKIRNIWAAVDIRKKILFTALILLIYRFGCALPVPYVSSAMVEGFKSQYGNTIFSYMNILSGGALGQATFFALGISPYITAQIVIQLLTVAFKKLQEWSKDETGDGKRKIEMLTRISTIILAVVTSLAYFFIIANNGWLVKSNTWVFTMNGTEYSALQMLFIVSVFTAGASLIMWLGEKINERGIGNGISMILFANILASGPSMIGGIYNLFVADKIYFGIPFGILAIVVSFLMVYYVVYITNSERRIPVQYAKRVVGRKMYGGQNSNLPIKLNMTGVMPIIFASSIVSLPATISALFGYANATQDKNPGWYWLNQIFGQTSIVYVLLFVALIVAFSYFYIVISFDPVEVSNNLKQNGGSIPGIRPGESTAKYIKKILDRITFLGAIFLAIIAGAPLLVSCIAALLNKFEVTTNFFGAEVLYGLQTLTFGGSSLLIVIGVALETYRIIEAQMSMRHYKGFLQ